MAAVSSCLLLFHVSFKKGHHYYSIELNMLKAEHFDAPERH